MCRKWNDALALAIDRLTTGQLHQLATALKSRDRRLLRRHTTAPALTALRTGLESCEGACLLGFCAMLRGATTVSEVWHDFNAFVVEVERRLGFGAAARLVRFWDTEPEAEWSVLVFVRLEIKRRSGAEVYHA